MHRKLPVAVLSLVAFSWPVSAFADTLSERISQAFNAMVPETWADQDIKLAIGAGMVAVPDYDGSNNYKVQPLPILEFRWGRFSFQGNEIRYVLADAPVRVGIVSRLDLGRSEGSNRALHGMGKIGTSLETGGFAQAMWKNWVGQVELRQDILSGHKGLVGVLAGGRKETLTSRLGIIYGVGLTWGDGNYGQAKFGVTDEQAAASGYPQYHPGSGFTSAELRFIVNYDLTERLKLNAGIGYRRILGDAADAPFIKGPGSPNQMIAGLTFHYTLWRKRGTADAGAASTQPEGF